MNLKRDKKYFEMYNLNLKTEKDKEDSASSDMGERYKGFSFMQSTETKDDEDIEMKEEANDEASDKNSDDIENFDEHASEATFDELEEEEASSTSVVSKRKTIVSFNVNFIKLKTFCAYSKISLKTSFSF